MTKFISSSNLATLWSCIKSKFLTKNDALATYAKKTDIATVNGASLTGGGNVQILAVEGATITIDASPTQGSTNAIQSSAVYDIEQRLQALEDAHLVEIGGDDTEITPPTSDNALLVALQAQVASLSDRLAAAESALAASKKCTSYCTLYQQPTEDET